VKAEEDAFGQALVHCLEHGRGQLIVERDDGYVESEGVRPYFDEFARWSPVERQALRYVRGRVLDVGLGAGRVALELERRGRDVLGIDVSPLTVRVARRLGVTRAKVLPFENIDASLGTFDTVVMFMNNFGLFASEAGTRRMLRRLHRLTSDEGRVVATTRDPHDTTDPAHRAYHRRNRQRGRMPGQLRLRLRFRRFVTPWFDYLFVSPGEMERLLRGTGWHVRRFIRVDDPFYAAVIEKDA
jgi:SAM-dependent methyltransferase